MIKLLYLLVFRRTNVKAIKTTNQIQSFIMTLEIGVGKWEKSTLEYIKSYNIKKNFSIKLQNIKSICFFVYVYKVIVCNFLLTQKLLFLFVFYVRHIIKSFIMKNFIYDLDES